MPVPACKNIACEERILFALTEKIADGFLGHLPKFHAPSSNVEYIVPDKTEDWLATLRRIQPTILITGWHTPALPQEWIESPEFSLRYLCHLAGTVKHVCPRRVLERGVLVSNWGSTVNHTIAEHALLLVLGALRSTAQWNAWQPDTHNQQAIASSWHDAKTTLRTRSLRGRRVGLHGLGSIARETIKLLRPFNVTLSAFSDGVPAMEFQNCDVRQCASLEELFSTNEIIIECEALTPASRGSVTEKLLALLPDDAVFVNVGRGEVVDENALARLATQKTPDATAAGGGGGGGGRGRHRQEAGGDCVLPWMFFSKNHRSRIHR
ncbi:hydroxyacid dehydrogenase [Opitutaceae bacterium TAV3]|nr:hydroxyacid dehydrogenase [Opitutaceae bacterium TAV3]